MAQMALLFTALSVATYWMLVRKKKRESAEWVPAALVRAYLDRVRAEEADIRFKLFGEAGYQASPAPLTTNAANLAANLTAPVAPTQVVVNSADPALAKEIEALRAQLTLADQRAMEFDRAMNGLKAEKAALEQKLKEAQAAATAAPAGAAATSAAPPEAVQKELEDLRAKLQEYSVIEDDLANLKKFQKENETLRQKLDVYEKGGTPTMSVIQGGAGETPAPEAVVKSVTEKIETPVTVVAGGAPEAAPSPAVTEAAPVQAAAPQPAPEANTNVLEPVTPPVDAGAPAPAPASAPAAEAPAATAAPAAEAPQADAAPQPEKTAKQKEEELLSEFEKMLAS